MPEQNFLDLIEPLHTQGLSDYHCHCDYSIDAVGSMDDYCLAAIKRGLSELFFTTHYDCNPNGNQRDNYIVVKGERVKSSLKALESYVGDVEAAHEKFHSKGLTVNLGLEFGYYRGCENVVRELKEAFEFDYFLCGIHELDDICICCQDEVKRCFGRFDARQASELLVDYVCEAAESKLFDAIAHLDYIRKYGGEFYGEALDVAINEAMPRAFESLKSSNTSIEINTGGLRKKINHPFPKTDLINMAKKAGVTVENLGSDAHRPEEVGFAFEAVAPFVVSRIISCEG